MKIRKGVDRLPSGKYRYRLREGGESYQFTDSELLSQREARQRFTALIGERPKVKPKSGMTFGEASKRHLKAIEGAVSPASERAYFYVDKRLEESFPAFYGLRAVEIKSEDVQTVLSEYAKTRKKNTVRSLYRYIRVVLKDVGNEDACKCIIPGKRPDPPYIPTDADVKAVFAAVKGTPLEIPVALAALGLRRSEICGLRPEDLDGNVLRLRRVQVNTTSGTVYKDTMKTSASRRDVMIPDQLANLIREKNVICDLLPDALSQAFTAKVTELGLRPFSIHKMRHFYASTAHSLGVPDAFIMRAGGWASPGVLRTIYTHALADKQAEMDSKTVAVISGLMTNS